MCVINSSTFPNFQDSFVMSKNQSSRERDIELGSQFPTNKSDYGMEDFFKQVPHTMNVNKFTFSKCRMYFLIVMS